MGIYIIIQIISNTNIMNHILHNISVIILAFGIILMTMYVTKATYVPTQKNITGVRRRYKNDIYDDNPSKVFKSLFNQPSTWQGYQSLEDS